MVVTCHLKAHVSHITEVTDVYIKMHVSHINEITEALDVHMDIYL